MKVQVIRQRELTVGVGNQAIKIVRTTYSTEGYPPRTVWIDKSKYSKQAVIDFIRADLKDALHLEAKEVELVGWEPLP